MNFSSFHRNPVSRPSRSLFLGALTKCLAVLLFPVGLLAAALISCPDCNQPVSARALMCPHCGCPGQVIAASAPAEPEPPAFRPAFFDSVVKVASELSHGWGTAVVENGALHVVTSFELLGAESLALDHFWTNAPLAYQAIELADDCALVRLRITATNLSALRWGELEATNFLVIQASVTNSLDLIPAHLIPGTNLCTPARLPAVGSPVLDSATNLVAVVLSVEAGVIRVATRSPVRRWLPIQPRDFRQQLGTLQEARGAALASADSSRRRQAVAKLRATTWATAFLKTRAETLAKQLEPKT